MTASDRPVCVKCQDEGRVANSERQEPWSMWENLPPGSDLAVQLGVVRPIPCPACSSRSDTIAAEEPPWVCLYHKEHPHNGLVCARCVDCGPDRFTATHDLSDWMRPPETPEEGQ